MSAWEPSVLAYCQWQERRALRFVASDGVSWTNVAETPQKLTAAMVRELAEHARKHSDDRYCVIGEYIRTRPLPNPCYWRL